MAIFLERQQFLARPDEVGWPRHATSSILWFKSKEETKQAAQWINSNLVGDDLPHDLGPDYTLTISAIDIGEAERYLAFPVHAKLSFLKAVPILVDPIVESSRRHLGDIDCHGAIFVYKDDKTKDAAWKDVEEINRAQVIRGELHWNKDVFLQSLRRWNEVLQDPDSAMLCIYAHAGLLGINCKNGDANRRVLWAELADALPQGVALIWMLGCTTVRVIDNWSALTGPVKDMLFTTTASVPWRRFLIHFRKEMDMKCITPYDKMPTLLRNEEPELAQHTRYFCVKDGIFKEFQPNGEYETEGDEEIHD
jgi:hypothetical protein